MNRCLIIFAKEPRKGKVKTRLAPLMSEDGCLNLYKAFLRDTIDLAKKTCCEERIIAYESFNGPPRYLKTIAAGFSLYRQNGKDLGQKMHNAFKYARKIKADKIIIIGSDSPDLPVGYIDRAFKKLNQFDMVLGPSHDGGYYLVGLKHPREDLFEGIPWSSPNVFAVTLNKARAQGKRVAVLKKWLDIDEPENLANLIANLMVDEEKAVAKHTRRFFHAGRYHAI